MQKRVVVLNGHKVLQAEQDGAWTNERVEKAGALRPGLYELFLAQQSDRSTPTSGALVIVDDGVLYQSTGTGVVAHTWSDFDVPPAIGMHGTVNYDSNMRATFSPQTPAAAPAPKKRSR